MGDTGKGFMKMTGFGLLGELGGLFKGPDMPAAPTLPPPVEEVDVAGAKKRRRAGLQQRQGRQSTILASQPTGKKQVLG